MDEIFSTLFQATKGAQYGLDAESRSMTPELAIVSNNVDPQGRRRIKVVEPSSPAIESDWVRRIQIAPGFDPPLPVIGSTVLVTAISGDVTNRWYSQAVNDTNKPLGKADAINDFYSTVPGDTDERTDGDRTINVGKSLKLQTDSGASIELTESGDIIITDGSGNSLNFSNGIAFNVGSSLSVNGKQIASVDALDNSYDYLINRGWN